MNVLPIMLLVIAVAGGVWKAVGDLRWYHQAADARLVDIAAEPDRWLSRLRRSLSGCSHGAAYNALRGVDAEELEAHKELCRHIAKCLNPVYALRLLHYGNAENRRFWTDMYNARVMSAGPQTTVTKPAAALLAVLGVSASVL